MKTIIELIKESKWYDKLVWIIVISWCICANIHCDAQTLSRNGKVIMSTSHTIKSDTIVSDFTYTTTDGKTYKVIVNKSSGACYIWKISKKTNRPYKQYLNKEIKAIICKQLGITAK